ncbi:hypothetical protein F4810DRAFT_711115 [Camillea tinctor]|nr:hypothetical protein F4810DRAFT_711115 [Camillea tinctor]
MNPHDPQGSGPYGSDTSSFYSIRSGSVGSDRSSGSAQSFWSSSESQSFVYVEDPRGCYGVRGAVTRQRDKHDDRRVRIAAHILSGPFARSSKLLYRSDKKHRCCEDGNGPCCRGRRSRSVSRSRHHPQQQYQHPEAAFNGPPPPMPMPPMHPHGPPPPRPPPPPQPPLHQHPPATGFENGFIQIPPAGAPMPPRQGGHDDPGWGWDQRGRHVEVFD